jgi:host factor-I protein
MSNELSLEQDFVNNLIGTQKPTSVFLKNGIKLTGVIVGIDEQCIFLKNIITQMIYKHAVSTIQP